MKERAEDTRVLPGSGAGREGPGIVLVLSDDPACVRSVGSALSPHGWSIHEARGNLLTDEGLPCGLQAIVVSARSATAADVLARLAWRYPAVVVADRYDPEQALDVIRRGAVDCVSLDQVDLLPAVLRREVEEAGESEVGREESAARIANRLLSPVSPGGRLDDYCEALARTMRASTAMVLVADPTGDMVAAGHCTASGDAPPSSIRIAADEVDAMRCGESHSEILAAVGLPAAAHSICTELMSNGHLAGIQILARAEQPFASSESELAENLARLSRLFIDRAETVSRLRRNDAIKTEFVRTVSHELRTPLNTVIGYSDLLVDEVFGPLDDEQRKILRRVGDRARGLLEVIAATLELPGVDSGRVYLETRPISVEALLAELEADAREWRVRHDLQYSWDVGSGLPTITTDAGKLRVLLKNLIANATKFTDSGGITVRARARDSGVEFSVEDTGIGIEGEAVHFVFDAFRQASAANARQYGGVGLGLYIVRRLVGILGGRLRVESEVGVGSKFFVWLPADAS